MTGPADNDAALAAQLRALLSDQEGGAACVTYQALARALGLAPPGTIQRVAAALEKYGVPASVLDRMIGTGPDNMVYLTDDELAAIGARVKRR